MFRFVETDWPSGVPKSGKFGLGVENFEVARGDTNFDGSRGERFELRSREARSLNAFIQNPNRGHNGLGVFSEASVSFETWKRESYGVALKFFKSPICVLLQQGFGNVDSVQFALVIRRI